MAGGLLWGFFLLASFTLSRADTHIRRQQTKKKKKKRKQEKKFCFGVKSGANITLCGMFDITTETPSVSNHNKAICSAWKKKKKKQNDTRRRTGSRACVSFHMCVFSTCGHVVLTHTVTTCIFFFKKKQKTLSSWSSRGLIPPELGIIIPHICCIVSSGPVLFNYPAGSSAIFSWQCAVNPATLFPMKWRMNGWMEGDAWTAPGGDYDKVNLCKYDSDA